MGAFTLAAETGYYVLTGFDALLEKIVPVFESTSPNRITARINTARLGYTTDRISAGRIGGTTATVKSKRLGAKRL